RGQTALQTFQIVDRHLIHRKPTDQRSPFGGHIRNGKASVHGQTGYARAGKLDRGVQYLVMVVETTERNDDVFSSRGLRQAAFEHVLCCAVSFLQDLSSRPTRDTI